jgi:MoxR-like ATPase
MNRPNSVESPDAVAVFDELAPIYERLDLLIAAASGQAPGASAAADPYRGLYVAPEDVARLLKRSAGDPAFDAVAPDSWPPAPNSRLAMLQLAFTLSTFELDLLLIALAPELDLRYERLFAFLQDDVTRRKPSVDLALNLLCGSAAGKLARRALIDTEAPLLRHGLLRLTPDPNQLHPPLLAHYLEADPQLVRWLFRQSGIDPRLSPFCSFNPPLPPISMIDAPYIEDLSARIADAAAAGVPLHLHFHGRAGIGKRETAQHTAAALGLPLLIADLGALPDAEAALPPLLGALFRDAQLRGALLYIDDIDTLREPGRSHVQKLLFDRIAAHPGVVITAGASSSSAGAGLPLHFAMPDFDRRRACWQSVLAEQGISLEAADLERLAGRFRLTPRRILDVARTARGADVTALMSAVRAGSGQQIGGVARKVESRQRWDALTIAPDPLAQLHELCAQVRHYQQVHGSWGFGAKLTHGRGISALFSGGSGTGKTMAAGIIANELDLDLYRIDLSQVVNKYIGETEKNLDRIFTAAQDANAILFFDEADALFGKRSEVKDAHDRYANIEVSYLLQKMEEYEGLAILATNLRQNLDEAFLRRLSFIVEFPFPDETQRRQIWSVLFPPAAPLAADVDFDWLAREVRLSGGHLRNIALAAAFLAASENSAIHQRHLLAASRREHQKHGRSWAASPA